ncbi:MAG: NUDIX domain-containing protein, partial [Polaromonas sp.]|nr:NUDIX domain-containing protein [Polaromonas sp.]
MARPTLQLHPRKEPVTAHPAATLLLLRDGALGVEVLMTRRSPKARILPGAYVFPVGRVDADDHQAHPLARTPGTGGRYRTAALAALRETFEELGILLAVQADGSPVTGSHLQELDRSQPFYPQLQARGWALPLDDVRMLACWTTDRSVPKRFDTAFFVALMPDQQEPVADEMEQFEPVWVRPQDALAQHQAGNFFMIFPTIRTLHWLEDFAQAEQALAACTEDDPLWNSCPRGGLVGGQPTRFMEHEAPYGELALVCPDGQLEHPLDWQHERPVPLLRHLHRLTAPNPSVMTGPGTNRYIVGDAASGYI